MRNETKTAGITKHEVGHFEGMAFYRVDEDALRREIETDEPSARCDINHKRTGARAVVSARAALELPEEMFRELTTGGGSAHSLLGKFTNDSTVRAYGSVEDGCDFRGLRKDDADARREKADALLDGIDTEENRERVAEIAVQNLIERVRNAVAIYNERTRSTFVESVGAVNNWGDDDAAQDEEHHAAKAEEIKQRIARLREKLQEHRSKAFEAKRERVLAAIDEADEEEFFGEVPAEWLEQARERAREDEPSTGGRIPFPA